MRSSRYNHTRTIVRMCHNNNQLTPSPPPSRSSPLTHMKHLLQALDVIKFAYESRPRISPGIETHPYPVHLCLHLETIIFVISICMHVCTYPIHTLVFDLLHVPLFCFACYICLHVVGMSTCVCACVDAEQTQLISIHNSLCHPSCSPIYVTLKLN